MNFILMRTLVLGLLVWNIYDSYTNPCFIAGLMLGLQTMLVVWFVVMDLVEWHDNREHQKWHKHYQEVIAPQIKEYDEAVLSRKQIFLKQWEEDTKDIDLQSMTMKNHTQFILDWEEQFNKVHPRPEYPKDVWRQ